MGVLTGIPEPGSDPGRSGRDAGHELCLYTVSICLIVGLLAMSRPGWGQSEEEKASSRDWGILVFGGQKSNDNLLQTLDPTRSKDFAEIYFVGAAVSRRIFDWRYLDLELEGGGGYQFSDLEDRDAGQIWAALYFRYDVFPWNDLLHTTVAISTGANYATNETDGPWAVQHYFSPELTFALPEKRDWELVFRLHHRSAWFDLLGCDGCGSNIVTAGIRSRF